MTIFPLTTAVLQQHARDAAEQGVPLAEANHYEPGSALWSEFNAAYAKALGECEVA
ncbi:hypothetical protein [Acidovorax sp. SUPP2539]|uniref:hypothetical protein n=1 Tax=Acidovorax sp. SUPP2539 TaxID=2920878 RepID=UPI0023DE2F74|nr:hypothetical protein [Acidovorax sp. SUPP2539]GKS91195.1 hypothetical protein AVTE2539_17540 [Acidovorax sp. SUPP2539]